ncbi:MAG TPA: hypothetical protein VNV65_05525 [Candidatus Solibacter sp.]|nr:hypothetical protein [Candidatus Solibacter sp.]
MDPDQPAPDDDLPPRRAGGPITDYGAALFLLVMFVLALGLMYLIGRGR